MCLLPECVGAGLLNVISLGSLSNYYLTTLSHTFVEVTKPGRNKNGLGCTFRRSFVSPSWCAKVTIHNGCHYKKDKWWVLTSSLLDALQRLCTLWLSIAHLCWLRHGGRWSISWWRALPFIGPCLQPHGIAQERQEGGESQGQGEPKRKVAKVWVFKSICKVSTGSQTSQVTRPSDKSPGTCPPTTTPPLESPAPYWP